MPIHPLAVVDSRAEVHPEATIGPFCVVQGDVIIAAGAELRSHASVYGRSAIGPRTILFPGAVVGGDPQDLKFKGEDSEVIVGADCKIHEYVTVNKGTAGGGMKTVVGDHCLIMAYAHVAHDCIVGDHVVIGNNTQLAGHVKVGARAIISGMVGVHHFASFGELSYTGAMSGVRYDVPPFMIADGNPAKPRKVNDVGLRRAGWAEEDIRALRDAFRVLFRDEATPMSQVLTDYRARMPAEARPGVVRLVAWMEEHLEASVRGRLLEATRQPALGMRTPPPDEPPATASAKVAG
jgi:UDP-N-acetylglucosamine acyltransferase